ncbi:MAG: TonB-dependent receptor [Bacteroidales bacterium]|nr:TonB-dependent receptor [Bacteroidales bacterium]
MLRRTLLLLLTLAAAALATAQGTIRGTLFDDSNGEAIPFANVVLEGTRLGCATDISGFFLISRIPEGNYTLRVRYIGYEEYTAPVQVTSRTQTLTLRLKPSSKMLETVEITDSKVEERRMQTQVSVEKITASQIQQMPSIGGQADLAQYMQVLPGISSTGDQGGQLYIRGGSMVQNLCLLDGMIVYNPFHSIGLYSIFETDVILNADIYTGGFGAEYGGRLSSVMDITTRDGNKRHHSGKLGLNTFGASLIMEGPLKRETDRSKTSFTYLLTAKNSFLSRSSTTLYPYIDGGLPFDFLDLYGKLTLNSGTGSKVSLFGFRFDDQVLGYQALADYHWQNIGAGTNFSVVTGTSAILDGNIAYSDYNITLDNGSAKRQYSSIGGFNLTLQITNFLAHGKLKYGISMEGYNTDYRFTNTYGYTTTQAKPSTNLAGYATYKWASSRLLLDPGLRLAYYATLGHLSPEPRLAAKFNLTPDLRLKFAGGLYSQIFLDARSDNDIVNLFNGFLTGSADLSLPHTFLGNEINTYTQKAKHAVLGLEYNLGEHTTLNLEAYYKHFDQLINANRNQIYDPQDLTYQSGPYAQPEYLRTAFIIEKGHAAGLDFSACLDLERLYLWATYSLGFVSRTDETTTYRPHYDRRHTINLLATYALGSQRQWELSTRWSYGSGYPYTQTQGIYQQLLFPQGIASDYTQENGHYSIHYADLYQGRLPDYHRLDLGIKRRFSLGKRSVLEVNASVTNLYSRQNIFYFDRTTHRRINQLPILACLGLSLTY